MMSANPIINCPRIVSIGMLLQKISPNGLFIIVEGLPEGAPDERRKKKKKKKKSNKKKKKIRQGHRGTRQRTGCPNNHLSSTCCKTINSIVTGVVFKERLYCKVSPLKGRFLCPIGLHQKMPL